MARRKFDKHWRDFEDWCLKRHLRALPAHVWTIAAYLRWRGAQSDGTVAEMALKSICRVHLLHGRRSPHNHAIILRTIESLHRQHQASPDRSNLFDDADFRVAPKHSSVAPEPDEDIEHDEGDAEIENDPRPPALRRSFSMRSSPRLVSRRR